MTNLLDVNGPNLVRGFENLKAAESPFERQLRDQIEAMWAIYEPYSCFSAGLRRATDGRRATSWLRRPCRRLNEDAIARMVSVALRGLSLVSARG
ncbi:hypothetical protein FHS78_002372 [Parvibaculum indicum]|uniref:hypothetical protein n=1 Tax=Parvibaculum indicum TaxID=562969 RepID=UPI00141FE276|nr:hypothetical protein [Parvibaculum indicum]NIJ42079.1 hypothetical protein [Parvibaculum indicum]